MKKLFTEPEIEILHFLCNGNAIDSVDVGKSEYDGVAGGNDDGAVPLG